jgi:hypothetical protein
MGSNFRVQWSDVSPSLLESFLLSLIVDLDMLRWIRSRRTRSPIDSRHSRSFENGLKRKPRNEISEFLPYSNIIFAPCRDPALNSIDIIVDIFRTITLQLDDHLCVVRFACLLEKDLHDLRVHVFVDFLSCVFSTG